MCSLRFCPQNRGKRIEKMELSNIEFRIMNSPARRFIQRKVELPIFKSIIQIGPDKDILEIGCGSGYAAALLQYLKPRSYIGIDLMPEQIELARKRNIPNAEFMVADATKLGTISDKSKDLVVIFGILHHVPTWKGVLNESYRALKTGGKLYAEEPDGKKVMLWDKIFKWGHPKEALFSLEELEEHLALIGFKMLHKRKKMAFGFYCFEKITEDRVSCYT